jgi:hypothetical protein
MHRRRHRFGGGGPVESGDKILQKFREPRAGFLFFESCIEKYKETYLRSYRVRGDGHCLFYAVIRCIVSALKYLSADTKATVTRVIGPDVIQKFKDGTYLGQPNDVELLRQRTYDIMRKLGDVSGCIYAALIGLEASKKGKSLDATDYADPDCSYLRAMSDALGVGIALEFPINPGSPERKWMFFQPGGDQMGLLMMHHADMGDDYRMIRTNGTQTPKVTCEHVIFLKLESTGVLEHYTSYLFDGDFVRGADEHEERTQRDADRLLMSQIKEAEGAEQVAALRAFEEKRNQEAEDAKLARSLAGTAFGATHPRRNRAFVSHVLRAASSHRFRY